MCFSVVFDKTKQQLRNSDDTRHFSLTIDKISWLSPDQINSQTFQVGGNPVSPLRLHETPTSFSDHFKHCIYSCCTGVLCHVCVVSLRMYISHCIFILHCLWYFVAILIFVRIISCHIKNVFLYSLSVVYISMCNILSVIRVMWFLNVDDYGIRLAVAVFVKAAVLAHMQWNKITEKWWSTMVSEILLQAFTPAIKYNKRVRQLSGLA